MKVTRFGEARPYEAANHRDVRSLRLQGFMQGGPEGFWVGLTHLLPGGGAGPDNSPLEKVYVVVAGALSIRTATTEVVLGPMDSCCIAPGETREIRNPGNEMASILVVMPYPEAAK